MNFSGPVVTLAPRSARPLWLGHPWVWERAVGSVSVAPAAGDVVQIVDDTGQPIDFALWSPNSAIRARLLGIGAQWPEGWPAARLPDDFFAGRLRRAASVRARHGLPSAETNAYRWVNSEGDALPGVVVDVYGRTAVLHLTTAAAFAHREALVQALVAVGDLDGVVVQTDAAMRRREGLPELHEVAHGSVPDTLVITERGVRFEVAIGAQKTGHFCDQRDHRAAFGALAAGRRVLDGFSYTGGFGLHAALCGATEVVGADTSADAIAVAERNAERNGVTATTRWVRKGTEDVIRQAADRGETFGLISLDPPKWAPSKRDRDKATRKLTSLCVEAIRVLEPEGHLVVSSCSRALGPEEIVQAITNASGRVHRRVWMETVGGQPPDHPTPIAMREGRYLAVVTVRVS